MLNPESLSTMPWSSLIREMENQTRSRISNFNSRELKGEALESLLFTCFREWSETIEASEENLRRFRAILRSMASAYNRGRPAPVGQHSLLAMLNGMGPIRYTDNVFVTSPTARADIEEVPAPAPPPPLPSRDRWEEALARAARMVAGGRLHMLNHTWLSEQVGPVSADDYGRFIEAVMRAGVSGYVRSPRKRLRRFENDKLEEMWQEFNTEERLKYARFTQQVQAVFSAVSPAIEWPEDSKTFQFYCEQIKQKES